MSRASVVLPVPGGPQKSWNASARIQLLHRTACRVLEYVVDPRNRLAILAASCRPGVWLNHQTWKAGARLKAQGESLHFEPFALSLFNQKKHRHPWVL